MANREPVFFVDPYQEPVLIKVTGRACFQNAAPLRDFFARMIEQGRRDYAVDFSSCESMDSTFLGILARASLNLSELEPSGFLALLNLSGRNRELVQNLGLNHIPSVKLGSTPGAGLNGSMAADGSDAAPEALDVGNLRDEAERARFVLEAHEDLCLVDARNRRRFQDVIAYLKRQLPEAS